MDKYQRLDVCYKLDSSLCYQNWQDNFSELLSRGEDAVMGIETNGLDIVR